MVDAEAIEHRPFGLARCSTERNWEAWFGTSGTQRWAGATRQKRSPSRLARLDDSDLPG